MGHVERILDSEEDKESIYLYLRNSRYFKNVPEDNLRKFLLLTRKQMCSPGEVIIDQGQENHDVFLILNGVVSVKVDGKFIYNLKRRGDIFGEMSVITGQPSSATIEAACDLELVRISSSIMRSMHEDISHELHHHFYKWFAQVLSEKLFLTSQKAKLYEDLSKQLEKEQRRLKEDLEAAKKVQQEGFHSNLLEIANFALVMRSEFTDFLGGDLYGVFSVDENHFGILMGDVSGHGTAAALIAVSTLHFFEHFSQSVMSSKSVMAQVNDLCIRSMPPNRFVTAFYAIYNVHTQQMVYTNGGHHCAMVLRDNKVMMLPVSVGLPLGLMPSELVTFSEESFTLCKGDRLILFTDAIFETRNQEDSKSDLDRFATHLQSLIALPSEELAKAIYTYSHEQAQGNYDDFTLMIFSQN